MTRSTFTGLYLIILGALVAPQIGLATTPIVTAPIIANSPGDITYQALEYSMTAGDTRTYLLNLPPNYQHGIGETYPLVFFFHGAGGTSVDTWSQRQDLRDIADTEDMIIVFPQGHEDYPFNDGIDVPLGYTWNATHCCFEAKYYNVDDVGFISELADHLIASLDIDTDRIHATGMSNGAKLTHRLAAELPDLFASVAPVAGTAGGHEASRVLHTFPPEIDLGDAAIGPALGMPSFWMFPRPISIPPVIIPYLRPTLPDWSGLQVVEPTAPIPVMMIRGALDWLVPLNGGQAAICFAIGDCLGLWWLYQLAAYPSGANLLLTDYDIWRDGNNCTTSLLGFVNYPGVGEVIDCESNGVNSAPMQLVILETMGHEWPTLGNSNFDGALRVIEFFLDHPK